jgi:hypothetical protein
MKKAFIYITSIVLLISSFYSCESDNEIVTPETQEEDSETTDLPAIIDLITSNNSGGVWEVNQAAITNSSLDNSIITGSYVIVDDVFSFTANTNETINLQWKKGFDINLQATNAQEILTDRNASTESFLLSLDSETGFLSSLDNSFSGNYDATSNQVTLIINDTNSNGTLSLNLSPKNQSDYLQAPIIASNPQELFQFNTGIFRVGFKVSQSQNSIYLTNRSDLGGIGSQQAFKYDLAQNVLTSFEFTQQDFATKNIEFIENTVASIGGIKFEIMNYDFAQVDTTIDLIDEQAFSNGTAALDDTVYLFGGILNGSMDGITTWTNNTTDLENIGTLPIELNDMDGEIVNQILYMFGGWDTSSSSNVGSTNVYTLDIDTGDQSQITIPVSLRETYTSTVENIIYVGGLQPIDSNNDGTLDSLKPYLGAFDTLDNSLQEITLNVGDILDNRRLVHLQVINNTAFLITSENIGSPNGFINRVYEADLN